MGLKSGGLGVSGERIEEVEEKIEESREHRAVTLGRRHGISGGGLILPYIVTKLYTALIEMLASI